MNIHEMIRLQGIDPSTFTKAVSPSELGKQIGNAMSVNVIERILHQVFQATTIVAGRQSEPEDRWKSGDAIRKLRESVDPEYTAFDHRLPKERVVKKILASSAAMRECIVDSGASVHIVSRRSLNKKELRRIRKASIPLILSTANGEVPVGEVIDGNI